MKYRPARELRAGRISVYGLRLMDLALPRLGVIVDGPRCVVVNASYGVEGHDPALLVELDLAGTRAGRLLTELVVLKRRWRP